MSKNLLAHNHYWSSATCGRRNFRKHGLIYMGALVLLLISASKSVASDSPWINASAAYYVDARDFSTMSVVLSSNRLPLGWSLWGFSDFHGDQNSNNFELTRSFSEYRLSHGGLSQWTNITGLGIQAEFDALSGQGNDVLRAGITYKHALPLPWQHDSHVKGWLQWRLLPYQSDNNGSQASLIFNLPLSERFGISGFADYNVRDNGSNRWVAEPELSYRMAPGLFALVEYRYNQFESANPSLDGSAFALGMRYQFNR